MGVNFEPDSEAARDLQRALDEQQISHGDIFDMFRILSDSERTKVLGHLRTQYCFGCGGPARSDSGQYCQCENDE